MRKLIDVKDIPKTKTHIMMNIATPETAFEKSFLPNSGVGLGMDRLVALMTDSHSIREIILFPFMKPKEEVKEYNFNANDNLLAVAIIRKDKNVAYYVLPLSILGALVAFYQYLLQMTPLSGVNPISCSSLEPCSAIQVLYLGFITIPFLSMSAFIIIGLIMLILVKYDPKK